MNDIKRQDIAAILVGFVAAFGISMLVIHTNPSVVEPDPVVHLVDVNSTSTMLVTTTTVKPVPSTIPVKPVKRVIPSTTSTTYPAPRSVELEAHIPDAGHEGDEEFDDPDANEHIPTDYDLPYATVDTGAPAS